MSETSGHPSYTSPLVDKIRKKFNPRVFSKREMMYQSLESCVCDACCGCDAVCDGSCDMCDCYY